MGQKFKNLISYLKQSISDNAIKAIMDLLSNIVQAN